MTSAWRARSAAPRHDRSRAPRRIHARFSADAACSHHHVGRRQDHFARGADRCVCRSACGGAGPCPVAIPVTTTIAQGLEPAPAHAEPHRPGGAGAGRRAGSGSPFGRGRGPESARAKPPPHARPPARLHDRRAAAGPGRRTQERCRRPAPGSLGGEPAGASRANQCFSHAAGAAPLPGFTRRGRIGNVRADDFAAAGRERECAVAGLVVGHSRRTRGHGTGIPADAAAPRPGDRG
ncbi:hypothetical protein SAMN05518801_104156 [Novosphingobium sp. CF614]|nr:hypothetical protein SAMN05518801_104156 [Novosphingobium sp. CF614]